MSRVAISSEAGLGKICFLVCVGYWHKSVPCGCRTENFSFLMIVGGDHPQLLEAAHSSLPNRVSQHGGLPLQSR